MKKRLSLEECGGQMKLMDSRESIAVILGFSFIVIYHLTFFKSHEKTIFGFGRRWRVRWMNSMTSDDKYNLLCVQSMRNEIQVVTCIGDVAFSALALIVTVSTALDLSCHLRVQSLLSSSSSLMCGYKLDIHPLTKIGVLCTFLAGIVACTFQACELLNRITVIGQCTSTDIQADLPPVLSEAYSVFMWLTQRLLIFTFPQILGWLFGPTLLCVTSLLCTLFTSIFVDKIFQRRLDKGIHCHELGQDMLAYPSGEADKDNKSPEARGKGKRGGRRREVTAWEDKRLLRHDELASQ
ncbi:hypothetical protein GUITHDRAFT_121258 [Guillardia theta CCMP2712]|uniref:Uncharacterized protein n=1 Tax=Guillardia theta (strain CCMP2712) TaxID=905079 RepID=L1I8J3_GUITC|nr:hypothetical protein GUITHDRAFT_121258 [Guillardia theta CCMP2712]EKX32548.1 hypothetical protein GUITHDRAFT_121258 [Guillardia theta CCMP2712]|eukprot:XP_005819528.1 hypothetical protein GUITHDRAFT_121258 [Guillardia theta CCMP2712]